MTRNRFACSVDAESVSAGCVLAQDELEDYTKTLCADKRNEELFRLQTGKTHCRDVVQCTDSVRIIINCFISLSFYGTVDYFIQFSVFIFIRVCKPSGVPLVLPSTWRSKVATGDSSSTTATGKRRRGKLCRGSATRRSCATAASSPAENNPPLFAFGEISSVTARQTVATGRMNLLAVDFCF